jgi:hypothetical protein
MYLSMKFFYSKLAPPLGLGLWVTLAVLWANAVYAQDQGPFVPPTTPMAQRNSLNLVLNRVGWLQNATRTTFSFAGGGYGLLLQQFQAVRGQYNGLKSTLTPQQLASGANQLAELDAGLDIIQEVFTDYQTAVANGQSSSTASANMGKVLNRAIGVWAQELKQDCRQLRIGW